MVRKNQSRRIKRLISIVLGICLMLSLMTSLSFADQKKFADVAENLEKHDAKYVAYIPNGNAKKVTAEIKSSNKENIVQTSNFTFIQMDADANTIKRIKENKDIIVEKNISFHASSDIVATDEQLSELQGENPDWNVDMVVDGSTGSSGEDTVKVAVMDSGIDDISTIPVAGHINMVEDEDYVTQYMEDMTGHGTAVASVIHSLDPDAELYSVRVLDQDNCADLQRVIRGIYWCIENDIDVINMSFGTATYSEILQYAIDDAAEAGITIVAAAGNSGEEGVEYPAAYEDTIAVGAVDNNADVTDFSAIGDEVDVVAPGKEIEVETMYGMHTWADGTSIAAPHVAAEAAMILANDTDRDNDFVKGLITETAKDLGDDPESGEGVIDVDYALEQYDDFAAGYTGSTAPSVPENNENVPTYDDDDVWVEARWGSTGHDDLFTQASNGAGASSYMSQDALTAMKRGGTYSDKPKYTSGSNQGDNVFAIFWHGQYNTANYSSVNYIACYRYITKLAKYGGDHTAYSNGVPGLEYKNKMDEKISASQIRGTDNAWIGWGNHFVMGNDPNNSGYLYSGSASRKLTLRQCFIYGMAIHQLTDSFAHSAYSSKSSSGRIVHPNADNATVCPKRYQDAKAGAQRTINTYINFKNNGGSGIGGINAYAPASANQGSAEGYYLANVTNYAIAANSGNNSSDFTTWFQYINYTV